MSDPLKIEYLNPFIEATIAAAARFRRVLIVVIIASTLAFAAFWNARSESWLNSRISVANHAEASLILKEYGEKINDNNLALEQIGQQLNAPDLLDATKGKLNDEKKRKLNEEREKITQGNEQLIREKQKLEQDYSRSDLENAEKWLRKRGIKRKEQLKSYAEKLNSSRVDYIVLIRIPFFGVVLDVNDLGALGGFTFVVILMWFRFSLWREYYNLRSTFKAAKTDEDLEFCYKTLAMSQVLTVPPALDTPYPNERPWGKVVRILYFLPLMVQLIIFAYDCISFDYGWDISPFNTVVGYSLSLSFLFLSALLTYWCFRLSSEIDKEWEKTARKLKSTLNT